MTEPASTHPSQPRPGARPFLGILGLGVLACSLAISRSSYWIDEAGVVHKAITPTLSAWWRELLLDGSSNMQLPFYHFFAWIWVKLVGINEVAMRWGNVPWFLAGFLAIAQAFKATGALRPWVVAAVLSSPFAWYYLNEARPYTMQFGASLVVFAALHRLNWPFQEKLDERKWVVILCTGALLLAVSGMLAMLWLGAYLAAGFLSASTDHKLRLARDHSALWVATLTLLVLVGLYYVWTLSIGARAVKIPSDIRSMLFVPYELLGFTGLGPGRLAMRSSGLSVLRPWLPWLAIYGAMVAVVLAYGWRQITFSFATRVRICWLLSFALVAGFILCVGVKVHFRVLGRHFTPLLPLLLFVIGAGLARLAQTDKRSMRITALAFVSLALISALNIRFSERHAKDDYRGAADLARQALGRGESVWWNADPEGAEIYGLRVSKRPDLPHTALWVVNPTNGFEADLPRPDLILASKPDVYDNSGALKEYLDRLKFRPATNLPAFTAWRSAPK